MPASAEVAAARIVEVVPLVRGVLAADLRRTGQTLDPAHFRLLIELYGHECTLGELAQRCAVSAPTISRSARTLEEKGWVRRAPSDQDGRMVVVGLTPQGRDLIEEMKRHAVNRIALYLQPLAPGEIDDLVRGFEVLQKAFEYALVELDRV